MHMNFDTQELPRLLGQACVRIHSPASWVTSRCEKSYVWKSKFYLLNITSVFMQFLTTFIAATLLNFNLIPVLVTTDHCSDCLCSFNGVITSPGFPNRYDKKMQWSWTIKVSSGHNIEIEYLSFDKDSFCRWLLICFFLF